MKIKPSPAWLGGAAFLWLLLAALALGWSEQRDDAAGAAGHPPPHLRAGAPGARERGKPTLLMLVHPQCPCSRASLTELNHLVALCPGKAEITVLLLRPAGCPASFTDTDLRRQAEAIPCVAVRTDEGGMLARRWGVETSGETLLYSADGRLLFHGGLTGSRGQEGDNAGLSAVAALLGGQAAPAASPVYGCPMTASRR